MLRGLKRAFQSRFSAFTCLGGLVALLLSTLPAQAKAQASDPQLVFRTVESRHFQVHYHEPLGAVARRVLAVAERAQALLAPTLAHTPTERTQVLLTDNTDFANGSASVLPRNTIRLFISSPEDLSTLEDYDDWLTELIVHEHTHVLHLDTIGGIPALINSIFGKIYPPNAVQPRWFLEGYATHQESSFTSAGRLRGTLFDMYLRMDALSDDLLTLAQVSNGTNRWPHGNVWYLYGSRFVNYIARHYGEDALTQISHDYGDDLIPYGMNRVARRATGRTFEQLYEDFLDEAREHYRAMAEEIRQDGLVGGERITFHGEGARNPRFVSERALVYEAGTRDDPAEIRRLSLDQLDQPRALVESRSGSPAVHPNGDIYLGMVAPFRDRYRYFDLFRLEASGELTRLTEGLRARTPDIANDGRRIAYVIHGAGTSHLAVANLNRINESQEVLHRSRRFEQVYTPRWSPNGQEIAASVWKRGGYRDIAIINSESGAVAFVTRDRALDTGPVWSPDGEYLYFSSDRSGVANIYAYHLATGVTHQVTNVISGAYQPAISAGGQTLVYVGYTRRGFDLFEMAIDPSQFRIADPYEDLRGPSSEGEATLHSLSESYDPLPTLAPTSWQLDYVQNGFGPELGFLVNGEDIVGYHAYQARIGIGLVNGEANVNLAWQIRRAPIPINLDLFRRVQPRGGFFIEGEDRDYAEDAIGGSISTFYSLPGIFHDQTVSASYSLSYRGLYAPLRGRLDPNDPPPTFPQTGTVGSIAVGWRWADLRQTAGDTGPSEGRDVRLSVQAFHPSLGASLEAISTNWSLTQFIENPFVQHHVLALRYAGGLAGGDLTDRQRYFVGGFPAVPLQDVVLNLTALGGEALRGYEPFFRGGSQYHLLQTEYRFPILRPEFGLGLLPLYLSQLHGSVFLDVGDAFNGPIDLATFRFGVGAELHTSLVVGYYIGIDLRIGLAYGLSEGGDLRFYWNIGSQF